MSPRKKASKTAGTGRRGRPPSNKQIWRTVLRLPEETSVRLKKAVARLNKAQPKDQQISINGALETIVEVWLKAEGL